MMAMCAVVVVEDGGARGDDRDGGDGYGDGGCHGVFDGALLSAFAKKKLTQIYSYGANNPFIS